MFVLSFGVEYRVIDLYVVWKGGEMKGHCVKNGHEKIDALVIQQPLNGLMRASLRAIRTDGKVICVVASAFYFYPVPDSPIGSC